MDINYYINDVLLVGANSPGVGKSYFSNLIQKTYAQHIIVALGDFVKAELSELFVSNNFNSFKSLMDLDIYLTLKNQFKDIVDLDLSSSQYVERMNNPVTKVPYRLLMQYYGTEIKRGEDPYYWCNKLYIYCKKNNYTDIIIPDCRFSNELEYFSKYSVTCSSVYLIDPKIESSFHSSETINCNDFDVQIGWNSRMSLEKAHSQFVLVTNDLGFETISLNEYEKVVKCL